MNRIMFLLLAVISMGIVWGTGSPSEPDALRIQVPVEMMDGLRGRLSVTVIDVDDEIVGKASKYVSVTGDRYAVGLDIALTKKVEDQDLLRVKVDFGGRSDIYSLYQLQDRLAVQILGQDEFIRGTPITHRVIVRNERDNAPIDGARVRVTMDSNGTKKTVFEGRTDRRGSCETRFAINEEVDKADLRFDIASRLGDDSYETRITIADGNVTYLVTDKPVYQPGQTIHIRSLSLRRPGLVCVKDESIVFEVEDSKGNKVYKKERSTDAFGVGYVQFTLADEVNFGDYTIRAILGQEKVEKTVNVKRYVLPKFKVEMKTEREYYMPAEQIEGDIDVSYFFGKPVTDAEVRITTYRYDIGFQQESVINGRTDKEGRYHFAYRLPDYFVGQPLEQGNTFVRLDVEVIDGAKHSEKISQRKKVVRDVISISLVPEGGSLRPGLKNRLYVLAAYPDGTPCNAVIEMSVDKKRLNQKSTDSYGIAEFEVLPRNEETRISVKATDEKGETAVVEQTFDLDAESDAIIMRMARGIYRVGESLDLTFLTTKRTGSVYVDVIKDDQTMLTKSIMVRDHHARLRLGLTTELKGSVWLHAYMVTPSGDIVRDTRFAYIHGTDDLLIDVRTDQKEYLPGQDAGIIFEVRGQDGLPRVAALCCAVVDEAVFAVSELQPGLERVYFRLEQEILKPRYEIHGFAATDIVGVKTRKAHEARAENVMFSTLVPKDHYPVHYTTPDLSRDKIRSAFYVKLERARFAIFEAQNKYFQKHGKYPKSDTAVETFIAEGLLKEKDILDPWGRRYEIQSPEESFQYFTIASSGPDGVIGNRDDVSDMMWDEAMPFAIEMDAKFAMPAAGARAERDMIIREKETTRQQDEEPRVREFFPETFVFEPAIITDAQGMARLDLAVPDAITTWRITTFGSSCAGELGSALGQLRVFQEFFVDIDLPVSLTEGDEISIPVAMYNYLDRDQRIRVVLQAEDWFDFIGDREIVRDLKRDGVSVAYFPIRIKKIGYHSMLVRAYGEVKSDAIKRSVAVLPDGISMKKRSLTALRTAWCTGSNSRRMRSRERTLPCSRSFRGYSRRSWKGWTSCSVCLSAVLNRRPR